MVQAMDTNPADYASEGVHIRSYSSNLTFYAFVFSLAVHCFNPSF